MCISLVADWHLRWTMWALCVAQRCLSIRSTQGNTFTMNFGLTQLFFFNFFSGAQAGAKWRQCVFSTGLKIFCMFWATRSQSLTSMGWRYSNCMSNLRLKFVRRLRWWKPKSRRTQTLADSINSFEERKDSKTKDTFDLSDWWKSNCETLPGFFLLNADQLTQLLTTWSSLYHLQCDLHWRSEVVIRRLHWIIHAGTV
jgi:hypothetical protein